MVEATVCPVGRILDRHNMSMCTMLTIADSVHWASSRPTTHETKRSMISKVALLCGVCACSVHLCAVG